MSGRIVSEDERFAAYFRDRVLELDVPTPPREAMWAAIAAQRSGGVRPIDTARVATAVTPVVAQAPVLTLADGALAPSSAVVVNAPVAKSGIARRTVPLPWAVPIAAALLMIGTGIGFRAQRQAGQSPALQASVASNETFNPERTADIVTGRHFAAVKDFLVTFASDQRNAKGHSAKADAALTDSLSKQARNMLEMTLTLSDSPMEMDPDRRKLLKDLADVLVQIVNLSSLPDDPQYVEQSINRSNVMQRLQAKLSPSMEPRGI